MAELYKVLGQADLTTTTLTDIYTVPAATSVVLSSIVVCNRTGSAVLVRISIAPAGAADANAHYQVFDLALPANESFPFMAGITLATTDVVRAKAGTANAVSVSVFGTQVT